MKPRIQFIIMKIFMNIVKFCPKSLWFTVPHTFARAVDMADINLFKISLEKKMHTLLSNKTRHNEHCMFFVVASLIIYFR